MFRMSLSSVIGFVLLVIESFIVMKLKGMETIEFGGIRPFINVWAINFFFVFTILTHIQMWYLNKQENALKE